MIFTVISVAPDLSKKEYAHAIELGPPFVATATDYQEMSRLTGWAAVEQVDRTAQFLDNAKTFLKVDRANKAELAGLLGEEDYQQRLEKDANLIDAITKGLLRRDLHGLRAS